VQETIPDRFRGRVFALYDMAFSLPRVAAAGLAILLIPHLAASWIVALAGLTYLLWTPVPPWWIRRRRSVEVRFHAGSRADEVPRAVVIGGEEEPVELLGSWSEERSGVRLRRLKVRTVDGSVLELVSGSNGGRWRIEREVPSDRQPNTATRDTGQ
jgi:MFS family permease